MHGLQGSRKAKQLKQNFDKQFWVLFSSNGDMSTTNVLTVVTALNEIDYVNEKGHCTTCAWNLSSRPHGNKEDEQMET